jgi:hypothetical protein
MSTLMPLVQAVIVGILALVGIIITQAWTTRREYTKRRAELAEEVLALCYEAEDAIRAIRSPGVWTGEGGSRRRRENERAEESNMLDRAYVVIERYSRYEATFKNLKAKKYVFIAAFRGESHKPFETIDRAISKLHMASHMLATYYWPKMLQVHPLEPEPFVSQEQRDQFLKDMRDQQAIFYSAYQPDPITPEVADAVRMVEAITDRAAREYVAGFMSWWQLWNASVDKRFEV